MVSAVAVGWSGYASGFLESVGLGLPTALINGPELAASLICPRCSSSSSLPDC